MAGEPTKRERRTAYMRRWREGLTEVGRQMVLEKHRESNRRQYEKNRDQIREKIRERRRRLLEADPERVREDDRRYREANLERMHANARRYRAANREKIREKAGRKNRRTSARRALRNMGLDAPAPEVIAALVLAMTIEAGIKERLKNRREK